jgi:hypothetical protein
MTAKNQIDKKIGPLTFIIISVCLCFIAQCTQQIAGSVYSIEAVRTGHPLKIDGVLDEPAWQAASPVWLRNNRSGQLLNDEKISTSVMTCYDDTTLFIAFFCNDPDIWTTYTQHDEHLWEEEAVEVFIETDDIPATYVEIEVSPANVLFDSYIVDPEEIDIQATAAFDFPGIRTAVDMQGTLNKRDDTDKFWTVEMAVPFSDLVTERSKSVNTGTDIKINFYRLDKNQGREAAGYAWSPTGGRFHRPSVFGKLKFK